MVLPDNKKILQTSFPEILERVYAKKEDISEEETRNGQKTLVITKDNKKKYLHSRYNPQREAKTIVDSLGDIDDQSSILFYGTGMGYHIQLLLEKYKDVKCYIYEPIPELLNIFLANVNLKKLNTNRIVGLDTTLITRKLESFVDRNRDNVKIVMLPSHSQIYEQENKEFQESFLKLLRNKKSSLRTNYVFQKRWIINSLKNFPEVLNTPNIILEKEGAFKGKTAVLVAAGPSLNDEIENLREIKEKGLAYIFSVGSAVNTLIHHGIHPDAATTYDPRIFNQSVFQKMKDEKIADIPMIFGSSVGYETLENYPGKKYHMFMGQDVVARYLLEDDSREKLKFMPDAASIAIVTLDLLALLGFSKIILVGQNLGYRGKERYSSGISYSTELSDEEIKNGIWVKSVNGNEVLSNTTFNNMRTQMEHYITYMTQISIMNTTKDGAYIEGTNYLELREVIDNQLKEKIVDNNWLDCQGSKYNQEKLKSKIADMDQAYKEALQINKQYKEILEKIEITLRNQKFTKAENLYLKLNNQLIEIEQNIFYIKFILPMNRVHYKILVDSIDSLNEELNSNKKGNRILKSFRDFITICEADIKLIEPMFEELKGNII